MTYFIKGATDKGDIVLDPFSGTGTTAVIAKALERQYIGFDISEEYVQFNRDRVKAGPYLEPSFLHEGGVNMLAIKRLTTNDISWFSPKSKSHQSGINLPLKSFKEMFEDVYNDASSDAPRLDITANWFASDGTLIDTSKSQVISTIRKTNYDW